VKDTLTNSALTDLENLKKFYEEQLVPEVGQRFVGEIFARIETLVDHPSIGRIVPEYENESIREIIHAPFRVVYLRGKTTNFVVRIWRSERVLELPDEAET
jgi:toxin ParE1/3/4